MVALKTMLGTLQWWKDMVYFLHIYLIAVVKMKITVVKDPLYLRCFRNDLSVTYKV